MELYAERRWMLQNQAAEETEFAQEQDAEVYHYHLSMESVVALMPCWLLGLAQGSISGEMISCSVSLTNHSFQPHQIYLWRYVCTLEMMILAVVMSEMTQRGKNVQALLHEKMAVVQRANRLWAHCLQHRL